LIGDGDCSFIGEDPDGNAYNSAECGFDGGDCTSGTTEFVSWNVSIGTITFIFSTVLWLF